MTKKTDQSTYYATRNFNDTTGAGASFKAGDEVKAEAGAIANYEAAGLVTTTKPAEPMAEAA